MRWVKIQDQIPVLHKPVFISDGTSLGVASCYRQSGEVLWTGEGFGGYEWDWDFTPTHWAEIEIELPQEEKS